MSVGGAGFGCGREENLPRVRGGLQLEAGYKGNPHEPRDSRCGVDLLAGRREPAATFVGLLGLADALDGILAEERERRRRVVENDDGRPGCRGSKRRELRRAVERFRTHANSTDGRDDESRGVRNNGKVELARKGVASAQ